MREWLRKVAIETNPMRIPINAIRPLIRPTRSCPERTPIDSPTATAVWDLRTDISDLPLLSGPKPPGATEYPQDAAS